MATNKLINQIDLDLKEAEIQSLISSEIQFSIAYVIDSNHGGQQGDDSLVDVDNKLSIGEVLAKNLEDAGTSELNDTIYKPINSNITHIPVAGEFIIAMETTLGDYYLTAVNLFGDKSSNIESENIAGYVTFTDDDNQTKRPIKADSKNQKSVLENNERPFNDLSFSPLATYPTKFGDVNIYGRYGHRISFTRSNELRPEILLQNGISSIEIKDGRFSYIRKSQNAEAKPIVNRAITSEYDGRQILMDSDRLFLSIGNRGIFQETSGIISLLSDDGIFLNTAKVLNTEARRINLGRDANERVIQGNSFLKDFKELMDTMVRFAETLKAQDKILSLSHAANNFLTDLNDLGWNNFNEDEYLSEKTYIE